MHANKLKCLWANQIKIKIYNFKCHNYTLNTYAGGAMLYIFQDRRKQIHIMGAEKGGAMGISDRISRAVRGYAPPEMFEI